MPRWHSGCDDDNDVHVSVSPDIVGEKKTGSHLEKRSLYGRPTTVSKCLERCAMASNDQVFHLESKGNMCCAVVLRGIFSKKTNSGKTEI